MTSLAVTPAPPRGGPALQEGGQFTQPWSGWFRNLSNIFNRNVADTNGQLASINSKLAAGINATVVLAKLTTGGTNGSLTVVGGLITAYTAPT